MIDSRSLQALRQPTPRTGRLLGLVCLLVALLWAPVWGQWHGLAHQMRQGGRPEVASVSVSAPVFTSAFSSVFAPMSLADQDSADLAGSAPCQVLDHLTHAGGLVLALAPLPQAPLAPIAAQVAVVEAVSHGLWGPVQARAPPRWI